MCLIPRCQVNGYIFESDENAAYFYGKSWYIPNANFNDSSLAAIERANIDMIVNYET